ARVAVVERLEKTGWNSADWLEALDCFSTGAVCFAIVGSFSVAAGCCLDWVSTGAARSLDSSSFGTLEPIPILRRLPPKVVSLVLLLFNSAEFTCAFFSPFPYFSAGAAVRELTRSRSSFWLFP